MIKQQDGEVSAHILGPPLTNMGLKQETGICSRTLPQALWLLRLSHLGPLEARLLSSACGRWQNRHWSPSEQVPRMNFLQALVHRAPPLQWREPLDGSSPRSSPAGADMDLIRDVSSPSCELPKTAMASKRSCPALLKLGVNT